MTSKLLENSRRKNIIIFTFMLLVLLGSILNSYLNYKENKATLYSSIDKILKNTALHYNTLLRDGFHERALDKNSITKEEDLYNIEKLSQYINNIDVVYGYTIVLNDDKLYFTSSSSTKEEIQTGDETFYFDHYESADEALYTIIKNKEIVSLDISDKWGVFRSVYIPLQTKNGTPYLLCADVKVSFITEQLDEYLKNIFITQAIIILLLLLIGSHFIRVSKNEILEIDEIKQSLENINIILEEQVNEKTKALNNSLKAKEAFMANMSHELRTPLNSILGFSSILSKKQKDIQLQDYAKQINTSAKSLLLLINDILDLSKIHDSKFQINPYEFNAYAEAKISSVQIDGLISEKSIHLKYEIDDTLKGTFFGDWIRINQIILNIVSNAVKFTTKDGSIDILLNYAHQALHITVSDNGIGMSEAVQNKAFKPFEQADGSTTRKYGGTGLGLSITQTLVEMMQGKIDLKSKENEGTTFTITIPLKKIKDSVNDFVQNENSVVNRENTLQGHVLVAEDNKTNQMLIRVLLEDFGLSCDVVNDGKEALDIYNPNKHALILMDENMPNMSGTESMQAIRSKYKEACTPILSLTANAMEGDREKFLKAGMDGYITKPIDDDKLYETLEKFLTR